MTSEATRRSMQGNKRRDTKPELILRRALRAAGYPGYRLQWKKAPGHPDITYPGRKLAIFVNGCFWHHHQGCGLATMPKTNQDFWRAKFERNMERDRETTEVLESAGWTVVTVWECQLGKDRIAETVTRVLTYLEG